MSRQYEWNFKIEGVSEEDVVKIAPLLDGLLGRDESCDYFIESDENYSGFGAMPLCGGERPDERAVEVAKSVWSALGRKVPVEIDVVYVEDAPTDLFRFEGHEFEDEED